MMMQGVLSVAACISNLLILTYINLDCWLGVKTYCLFVLLLIYFQSTSIDNKYICVIVLDYCSFIVFRGRKVDYVFDADV